ncbi:MAG: A/G-specific adenine glycosylase [Proteobacteria bacterium]|nr:A/G-specific adenine glycosylase [Pseudomonadota bacterium]
METIFSTLKINLFDAHLIQQHLLPWYDKNRRVLPWRALPGHKPNVYHVWLSEIMLQQTTVPTVIPYFLNFIRLWPTVHALSEASLDDILHAWQGLGYYARARNLFKCAQEIATLYKGDFPSSESTLLTLPGIGPYTAAAIAAIAFEKNTSPLDGNIERVLSRVYAIDTPLPTSKSLLKNLARHHTPFQRLGDYAQALMDLGSLVCTPKNPTCFVCPLKDFCRAFQKGKAEIYPLKEEASLKPTRTLDAFWIESKSGALLLEKRPHKGLLGGLVMVPIPYLNKNEENLFFKEEALPLKGVVSHTFTHFHLKVRVLKSFIERDNLSLLENQFWCPLAKISEQALPTLMKKIMRHVL